MQFPMKKAVACFTAAAFFLSLQQSAGAVEPPLLSKAVKNKKILSAPSLKLPSKIGKVEESFQGKSGPVVVIIQDAHSIPAAQINIHQILRFLQKHYGIDLVGIEGAVSQLDPEIFQAFPDKQNLQKAFQAYFDSGQAAGANVAAIFLKTNTVFQGVENWPLYEEGLGLYLAAMKHEKDFSKKLDIWEKDLDSKKQKIYPSKLREIDLKWKNFQDNTMALPDFLKFLAGVMPPPGDSEIALFLKELQESEEKNPASEDELEAKRLTKKIQKYFEGHAGSSFEKDLREFHQKKQQWATSQISAREFILFADALLKKYGIKARVSKALAGRVANFKSLRQIEGSRFFKAIEDYLRIVKDPILTSNEARDLDRETRQLELLRKLCRLELGREEWEELKKRIREDGGLRTKALEREWPDFLQYGIAFYQNAEQRDSALLENLLKSMSKLPNLSMDKNKTVVMVAGGFHAQGLSRLLTEKNISHALVMPAIEKIPEEIHYRDQMRGEVPWSRYFRVSESNGKINVYEAFVRYVRDDLLKQAESSGKDFAGTAKLWRDEIIRNLAVRNKIEEAGKYTQFIDEVWQKKKAPAKDMKEITVLQKIDRFINGLKQLKSENKITEQNILSLLKPGAVTSGYIGPVVDPLARVAEPGALAAQGEVSAARGMKDFFEGLKGEGAETPRPPGWSLEQIRESVQSARSEMRTDLSEKYFELEPEDAAIEARMDQLFEETGIDRDAGPTKVGWHTPLDAFRAYQLIRAMKISEGGQRVSLLDLGSGQAELALRIALSYPSARITAIEFDTQLMTDARKLLAKAEEKGWIKSGQVSLFEGNYNSPEFIRNFQEADKVSYYVKGTQDVAALTKSLLNLKPGAQVYEVGTNEELGPFLVETAEPLFQLTGRSLFIRVFERLPSRSEMRAESSMPLEKQIKLKMQIRTKKRLEEIVETPTRWGVYQTSLADLDRFLDIPGAPTMSEMILARAKAVPEGQRMVVLDWGAGNGRALLDLRELLEREGLQDRVRLIGFGSDYFDQWLEGLDKGIEFILDEAAAIQEYFRPGEIDFIYSYFGLHHISSEEEPAATGKYIVQKLGPLISPEGTIFTTINLEDAEPLEAHYNAEIFDDVALLSPRSRSEMRVSGDPQDYRQMTIDFGRERSAVNSRLFQLANFGMTHKKLIDWITEIEAMDPAEREAMDRGLGLSPEAAEQVSILDLAYGNFKKADQINEAVRASGLFSVLDVGAFGSPENRAAVLSYLAYGEALPENEFKNRLEANRKVRFLARDEGIELTSRSQEHLKPFAILKEIGTAFSVLQKAAISGQPFAFSDLTDAFNEELLEIESTWGVSQTLQSLGEEKIEVQEQPFSGPLVDVEIKGRREWIEDLLNRSLNLAAGYAPQQGKRSEMRTAESLGPKAQAFLANPDPENYRVLETADKEQLAGLLRQEELALDSNSRTKEWYPGVIQGALEIRQFLAARPGAQIISLGASPEWLIRTLQAMENFYLPEKPDGRNYYYAAFSGFRERTMTETRVLTSAQTLIYRDYLSSMGLTPKSVAERKGPTLFFEIPSSGSSAAIFMRDIWEDWAREEGVEDQVAEKWESRYLREADFLNPGADILARQIAGEIMPNLKVSSFALKKASVQILDPALVGMLMNSEKWLNNRSVPVWKVSDWAAGSPSAAVPIRAALTQFQIFEYLESRREEILPVFSRSEMRAVKKISPNLNDFPEPKPGAALGAYAYEFLDRKRVRVLDLGSGFDRARQGRPRIEFAKALAKNLRPDLTVMNRYALDIGGLSELPAKRKRIRFLPRAREAMVHSSAEVDVAVEFPQLYRAIDILSLNAPNRNKLRRYLGEALDALSLSRALLLLRQSPEDIQYSIRDVEVFVRDALADKGQFRGFRIFRLSPSQLPKNYPPTRYSAGSPLFLILFDKIVQASAQRRSEMRTIDFEDRLLKGLKNQETREEVLDNAMRNLSSSSDLSLRKASLRVLLDFFRNPAKFSAVLDSSAVRKAADAIYQSFFDPDAVLRETVVLEIGRDREARQRIFTTEELLRLLDQARFFYPKAFRPEGGDIRIPAGERSTVGTQIYNGREALLRILYERLDPSHPAALSARAAIDQDLKYERRLPQVLKEPEKLRISNSVVFSAAVEMLWEYVREEMSDRANAELSGLISDGATLPNDAKVNIVERLLGPQNKRSISSILLFYSLRLEEFAESARGNRGKSFTQLESAFKNASAAQGLMNEIDPSLLVWTRLDQQARNNLQMALEALVSNTNKAASSRNNRQLFEKNAEKFVRSVAVQAKALVDASAFRQASDLQFEEDSKVLARSFNAIKTAIEELKDPAIWSRILKDIPAIWREEVLTMIPRSEMRTVEESRANIYDFLSKTRAFDSSQDFGRVIDIKEVWGDLGPGDRQKLMDQILEVVKTTEFYTPPDNAKQNALSLREYEESIKKDLEKKILSKAVNYELLGLINPQGAINGLVVARHEASYQYLEQLMIKEKQKGLGRFLLLAFLKAAKAQKIRKIAWDAAFLSDSFYHRVLSESQIPYDVNGTIFEVFLNLLDKNMRPKKSLFGDDEIQKQLDYYKLLTARQKFVERRISELPDGVYVYRSPSYSGQLDEIYFVKGKKPEEESGLSAVRMRDILDKEAREILISGLVFDADSPGKDGSSLVRLFRSPEKTEEIIIPRSRIPFKNIYNPAEHLKIDRLKSKDSMTNMVDGVQNDLKGIRLEIDETPLSLIVKTQNGGNFEFENVMDFWAEPDGSLSIYLRGLEGLIEYRNISSISKNDKEPRRSEMRSEAASPLPPSGEEMLAAIETSPLLKGFFSQVQVVQPSSPDFFSFRFSGNYQAPVGLKIEGDRVIALTTAPFRPASAAILPAPQGSGRELLRIFLGALQDKGFKSVVFEYLNDKARASIHNAVKHFLESGGVAEGQRDALIASYEWKELRNIQGQDVEVEGMTLPLTAPLDFTKPIARSEMRAKEKSAEGQTEIFQETRTELFARIRQYAMAPAEEAEAAASRKQRLSLFYDAFLDLLNAEGYFRNQTLLLPAGGLDIRWARYAPAVILNFHNLLAEAHQLVSPEDIEAIRSNLTYLSGIDLLKADISLPPEFTEADGGKTVILKKINDYVLKPNFKSEAARQQAYQRLLERIDQKMNLGDKFLVLSPDDARMILLYLEAQGYELIKPDFGDDLKTIFDQRDPRLSQRFISEGANALFLPSAFFVLRKVSKLAARSEMRSPEGLGSGQKLQDYFQSLENGPSREAALLSMKQGFESFAKMTAYEMEMAGVAGSRAREEAEAYGRYIFNEMSQGNPLEENSYLARNFDSAFVRQGDSRAQGKLALKQVLEAIKVSSPILKQEEFEDYFLKLLKKFFTDFQPGSRALHEVAAGSGKQFTSDILGAGAVADREILLTGKVFRPDEEYLQARKLILDLSFRFSEDLSLIRPLERIYPRLSRPLQEQIDRLVYYMFVDSHVQASGQRLIRATTPVRAKMLEKIIRDHKILENMPEPFRWIDYGASSMVVPAVLSRIFESEFRAKRGVYESTDLVSRLIFVEDKNAGVMAVFSDASETPQIRPLIQIKITRGVLSGTLIKPDPQTGDISLPPEIDLSAIRRIKNVYAVRQSAQPADIPAGYDISEVSLIDGSARRRAEDFADHFKIRQRDFRTLLPDEEKGDLLIFSNMFMGKYLANKGQSHEEAIIQALQEAGRNTRKYILIKNETGLAPAGEDQTPYDYVIYERKGNKLVLLPGLPPADGLWPGVIPPREVNLSQTVPSVEINLESGRIAFEPEGFSKIIAEESGRTSQIFFSEIIDENFIAFDLSKTAERLNLNRLGLEAGMTNLISVVIREALSNTFNASPGMGEKVSIEASLMLPKDSAPDQKPLFRVILKQPAVSEADWQRLEANQKGFREGGAAYLLDTTSRESQKAFQGGGTGLLRFGDLMQETPASLRYKKILEPGFALQTEIRFIVPSRSEMRNAALARVPEVAQKAIGEITDQGNISPATAKKMVRLDMDEVIQVMENLREEAAKRMAGSDPENIYNQKTMLRLDQMLQIAKALGRISKDQKPAVGILIPDLGPSGNTAEKSLARLHKDILSRIPGLFSDLVAVGKARAPFQKVLQEAVGDEHLRFAGKNLSDQNVPLYLSGEQQKVLGLVGSLQLSGRLPRGVLNVHSEEDPASVSEGEFNEQVVALMGQYLVAILAGYNLDESDMKELEVLKSDTMPEEQRQIRINQFLDHLFKPEKLSKLLRGEELGEDVVQLLQNFQETFEVGSGGIRFMTEKIREFILEASAELAAQRSA